MKREKFKKEKNEEILNTSYETWSSGPFISDLNSTFNSVSSISPTSQPSTSIL